MPHKKIAAPLAGGAALSILNAEDYSPQHHLATTSIAHAARYISGTVDFRDFHEIGTTTRKMGSFTDPSNQLKKQPVHHNAGAIIHIGADNTKGIAVATPTESGVLSRLNSGTRMHCGCYVFWQDGPYRKAGRTAIPVLSTSCAPNALDKAFAGFQPRIGEKTMTTASSTHTPKQSTGNTPDYTSLSFVKVEYKGPRKQRLTTWFNVPNENYGSGNARGYRVAAELMSWLQQQPVTYEIGMIVREIMGAAFAVLAQPHTQDKQDKRGAAVTFLDAMAGFVMFAATHCDHQSFLAAKAQRCEDWAKKSAQMEAERNRETGRRLAAARKAKREAKAMEVGAA